MFTFWALISVVYVHHLVCLLYVLIAVASRLPPVSGLCEVLRCVASLCVRALNFVHIRCVNIFTLSECVSYYRNRRTLWSSLSFAFIWFILSSWYYKVAATLFSAFFFGDCVLTGHRKLLCDALDCCSRCVVILRRASKLWIVTTLGDGSVEWVMAR